MGETHWKKLTHPDYLGAYAFNEGEIKTATIKAIKEETVTGQNGAKEDCLVCYFDESIKPSKMILNKTNCKSISKALGTPYIERWIGKQINLHTESVSAYGTTTDAVRVMTTAPKKAVNASGDVPKCEGENCPNDGVISAARGMDAMSVAKYTKRTYGRYLCAECATREKANEA